MSARQFLNRRDFIKITGVAVAAVAAPRWTNIFTSTARDERERRPNILYVFPDEMRQQAICFMKQDPVITPHLDRFASEGLVFTHAVSNAPVCSPYRAMLFTGKYPVRNQVLQNCTRQNVKYGHGPEYGNYLHEKERCVSDVLHAAGYSLGYIGKLHLDTPNLPPNLAPDNCGKDGNPMDAYTPPGPRRHGFDFWYSYGCSDDHLHPHYWVNNAKLDELLYINEWSVKHETDIAIDFIRNRDGKQRATDKPFALFVAHNPPHMPFNLVPEKYREYYKDKSWDELLARPNVDLSGWTEEQKNRIKTDFVRNYFSAITGIDENFGRLLACLKEEGLDKDTIVIFTSDHGEMMGSHGRMYKDIWYDEAFLVPFIIRWPEHIKPGKDDLLLSVPDIMPTLLGLAGLGRSIPAGVEGADYSDLLLGKETVARPDSAFYFQHARQGVRTHRYTFAIDNRAEFREEILHLYDNENDPYQLNNICLEEPGIVKELYAKLKSWRGKIGLTKSWCNTIGLYDVERLDARLQRTLKSFQPDIK